jgi:hypothetical protein
MKPVRTAATVLGLSAFALLGLTGVVQAAGSGGGSAAPVVVTNSTASPVPVAGTVNVGNFPAAPTPTTVQLLDTSFGGGGSTSATMDVSSYKTVRLYLGRIFGTGCDYSTSIITVALTDTATGSLVDVFEIGQVNHTNKVYEAPGTNLRLSVSGPNACLENVAMWGRSN